MSRNASGSSKTGVRDRAQRLSQAVAAHRAGRFDDAERGYRAVKRRDPDYGEALRLRGVLAYQRQRRDEAIKLLRRAVTAQPSNPVAHHSLAEVLSADGRLDAAAQAYARAYALQPSRHATAIDLGDTRARAGDSEGALAAYTEILDRQPDHADAHERIARLHHERGDPGAAGAQLEAWVAVGGAAAATRRRQGAAFNSIGAAERAAERYRCVLADAPDDALAHAGLGVALQSQGDFMAARDVLERALELRADLGWVYAALMSDRAYRSSTTQERAMGRLADAPDTDAETRSHVNFALGALHDRRREHAQAFARFGTGNRLMATSAPFDAERFDDRIARIRRVFTRAFFAERADHGHPTAKPVFVVGMPRSGTSLVEQIVASHPRAAGAGELEDIRRMVRELPMLTGGGARFPECAAALDADDSRTLGARYLHALEARAPGAERVTDKMPFNLLWLGLISLVLPNARVIFCRRDAMDNCLSCYFQIFSQGMRFTYDLAHLGHVYRQQERLMAHWADVLPLPMLTVDYESLVADPNRESRRLIDFAGLEWDDACLDFHRTERTVRTASVWQVRQPVYRSSVARWRAYEPWLGPLQAALADTPPA